MKKSFNKHIWIFFVAVYLVSGLLYSLILVSGSGIYTIQNKILMVCVAFTPSVMGIIFVILSWDRPARRDFWRRVFLWPKVRAYVIFLSLCLMPALNFIAYIAATTLSGEPFVFQYGTRMLTQLPLLLQFLVVEFFLGAVSEELGWRGYALDELQTRYSALTSSLIIGVIWAFWHTPAFFIPGLSQYEFGGIFSWNYLCMMIVVPAGSILHTWSYNNSEGSILVAGVLMHFTQNAALIFLSGIFDQFSTPTLFWPILTCLVLIVTAIIVRRFGAATLADQTTRLST